MERRGRPPTFTRDDLIAAASKLGPDELSLPALAAELGVSRTSLYWHVRDHTEVGEIVLAAIIDENASRDWEPERDRSWDEVLASYARAMRGGLLAAGGWIRYATPTLVLTQAQLRAMDGLVGVLCACGFPIDEATRAYAYLFQVVLASIGSGDAPVTEMHRALLSELLSAEGRFDTLREAVAVAARTPPDVQFEYDLDCTLRGIAARSGIPLGSLPKDAARSRRRRQSNR